VIHLYPDPLHTPRADDNLARRILGSLHRRREPAIATAAQSNAAMGVWLQTAQAADKVEAGLAALVSAGLLSATRKDEIIRTRG